MLKRLWIALAAVAVTGVAAFGAVVLPAGSATVPQAAISASPTSPVYWGCILKKNGSLIQSARIRIYDGTAGSPKPGCVGSAYQLVDWNQKGATGASGPAGPQGSSGPAGADGANAVVSIQSADALAAGGGVLTHVGGPIKTGVTPLTATLHLTAGTYQLNAYGDFSRKAGTGADNPAGNGTYGTLAVWEDKNSDGIYDWAAGENGGTVQTGALPITPSGSIEQSATLTEIVTLSAPTDVLLGGFAYNSDTSAYGTAGQPGAGDFSVLAPRLTAEKLNGTNPDSSSN